MLGAGIAGHTAAAFARSWLGRDRHRDGDLAPTGLQLGAVEHLGRRRTDEALDRSRSRSRRSTSGPGSSSSKPPRGRSTPRATRPTPRPYVTAEFADGRTHRGPLRLPDQRDRTRAALRQDPRPRTRRRPQPLGLPPGPRRAGRHTPGRRGRADAPRRAAQFLVGVGHGTCTCEGAAFEYIVNLEFELRNRGVRDQARDHLDHQRIRARRLRHGRDAPQARRLCHPQQHLQRLAVRRARDRLDHPRARPRGAARPRPVRDSRRRRITSRSSTSRCSCPRSPASA